jgi:hypothetical protein
MLLLYCMTPDDIALPCKLHGVGGAEVRDVAKNGVRYFYSDWEPAKNADEVKQQALQFHHATQEILRHATLIPFRFPTSMATEAELADLMAAQSSEYAQELERLRGAVQMKITVEGAATATAPSKASSGTEYLKQKRTLSAPVTSILEQIKRGTAGVVDETKQSHRRTGTVLFVLVQRDRIEQLRAVLSKIAIGDAKVSLTGPWPPAEFANCYPELPRKQG